MTVLTWDAVGQRFYETGVDHGVLYMPDASGNYVDGVSWNGLVSVSESPSGAESNKQYADNIPYLNLTSAEEFAATVEAFTYPEEFNQFDGVGTPSTGVYLGQQTRKPFGMSYRTILGNDLESNDYGYKIKLVYGLTAAPSEKQYQTVNDSPEPITMSWELSSIPVAVTGFKPTSIMTIDTTTVDPARLTTLMNAIYGTAGTDPRLPLPDEVITIFAGAQTLVTTVAPTFVAGTGVITIPTVTGVQYRRADTGAVVTGTVTIGVSGASLTITATPASGAYAFTPASDDDWVFTRS